MSIFQKRSSNINKLYKNIIFTPKNPRFFTPKMGILPQSIKNAQNLQTLYSYLIPK